MNLQKGNESWKIGGVNSGSRDLDSIRMGRQLIRPAKMLPWVQEPSNVGFLELSD